MFECFVDYLKSRCSKAAYRVYKLGEADLTLAILLGSELLYILVYIIAVDAECALDDFRGDEAFVFLVDLLECEGEVLVAQQVLLECHTDHELIIFGRAALVHLIAKLLDLID